MFRNKVLSLDICSIGCARHIYLSRFTQMTMFARKPYLTEMKKNYLRIKHFFNNWYVLHNYVTTCVKTFYIITECSILNRPNDIQFIKIRIVIIYSTDNYNGDSYRYWICSLKNVWAPYSSCYKEQQ